MNILHPNITDAYFARKVVTRSSVATEDGEDANEEFSIALDRVNDMILGREVYLVVEADNLLLFRMMEFNLKIMTADTNLTGTAEEVLTLMQGDTASDTFSGRFGDTTILDPIEGDNPYNNLDDFENSLIFKIAIRPEARVTFNTWTENISNADNGPRLQLEIECDNDQTLITINDDLSTLDNAQCLLIDDGPTLENKNVYEIYHPDNLFNTLGNHNVNNENVKRRISYVANESSTEVKYYFKNLVDNCYEICECNKTEVRRRNDGSTVNTDSDVANVPLGYVQSETAPEGGDAMTNYYYNQNITDTTVQDNLWDYYNIVTRDNPDAAGKDYGVKSYILENPNEPNDLVPLIRMPNNLNIDQEALFDSRVRATFSYRNTERRFCNPACFAGFLGVLIQLGLDDVVCTGMCFSDATSYPSVTHPNGDSVDTAYFNTLNEEQLKVDAFIDHYFTNIYRGNRGWYPQLVGADYSAGHNDHLHAGDFDEDLVHIVNSVLNDN